MTRAALNDAVYRLERCGYVTVETNIGARKLVAYVSGDVCHGLTIDPEGTVDGDIIERLIHRKEVHTMATPNDPLQPGRPIHFHHADANAVLIANGFRWDPVGQFWIDDKDGNRASVQWSEKHDRYFIARKEPRK